MIQFRDEARALDILTKSFLTSRRFQVPKFSKRSLVIVLLEFSTLLELQTLHDPSTILDTFARALGLTAYGILLSDAALVSRCDFAAVEMAAASWELFGRLVHRA